MFLHTAENGIKIYGHTLDFQLTRISGWFQIIHVCHSFWVLLVKCSMSAALDENAYFLAGMILSPLTIKLLMYMFILKVVAVVVNACAGLRAEDE